MKPGKNDDKISRIMNDSELVRKIIQAGVNDALLKHKQAGNPVCIWKDGKVAGFNLKIFLSRTCDLRNWLHDLLVYYDHLNR